MNMFKILYCMPASSGSVPHPLRGGEGGAQRQPAAGHLRELVLSDLPVQLRLCSAPSEGGASASSMLADATALGMTPRRSYTQLCCRYSCCQSCAGVIASRICDWDRDRVCVWV